MKSSLNRFWEIDTYRGIVIIMMIIYHVLFDLDFLNIIQINLHQLPFRLFLYPIGTSFLLLVGISLTLSYSTHQHHLSQKDLIKKYLLRGVTLFSYGLLITLITWFLIGDGFIVFGVLHCIGISIILSYPFLKIKHKIPIFLIGIILILIGISLRFFVFDFAYLLWLGFIPHSFYTLDYFPLLPWFGVVLIGISIGKQLYQQNKRRFHINDYSQFIIIKFLSYLGKHSLIIYLIHQPIILLILTSLS